MPGVLATAEGATSAVTTAFTTAATAVQTDVMGMITASLPIALGIGGAIMAIRLGWKFFRSMAK